MQHKRPIETFLYEIIASASPLQQIEPHLPSHSLSSAADEREMRPKMARHTSEVKDFMVMLCNNIICVSPTQCLIFFVLAWRWRR